MKATIQRGGLVAAVLLLPVLLFAQKHIDFNRDGHKDPSGKVKVMAVYEGVLPSKDGKGVKTSLVLFDDLSSYRMDQTYIGVPNVKAAFSSEGIWKITHGLPGDAAAELYCLDPDQPKNVQYFLVQGKDAIGALKLKVLDKDRNPLPVTGNTTLVRSYPVAGSVGAKQQ